MPTDEALDRELAAALRARGHRVTTPRLLVHRHVRRADGHVTADAVSAGVSGLSAATVYATLGLLEELGVVRRVSTRGGAAVFDSRPEPHHHAVCRRCGQMADIDAGGAGERARKAAAAAGFTVERTEVQVVGLCADCAA